MRFLTVFAFLVSASLASPSRFMQEEEEEERAMEVINRELGDLSKLGDLSDLDPETAKAIDGALK